jgi:predicted ribosome quality control (RQC) complex YloA/Tae2 family protein
VDAERRGLGLRPRGREGLNLSAAHVAELCGEIEPLVRGARIRDVHALPPRDAILVLQPVQPEGSSRPVLRLRLSADPEAPRLHIQTGRIERHEGPLGPFFRRLARDLEGGILAGIAPVRGDRIAILEVRESPSGERRALVLEVFGRRANLVLLGPEDRVVDVLVPPPPEKEHPRLAPGGIWHPPAGRPGEPGPGLAQALPVAGPGPVDAPLSWLVERALGGQAGEARRARAARDLAERVERRLERARGLVRGLEARLAASAEAGRVRAEGELLKANLAALRRGMKSAEVEDFFAPGAPPRRIELDPRLSPQENLERRFERARKLERSRGAVEGELEIARRRERDLAALLESAHDPAADAAALEEQAIGSGLLEKKQAPADKARGEPAPRLPYRVFGASRGSEIRVGRSARDNDDLTFRHAKGSDLWLHTADVPGSHVVLVLAKGADPDSEELVDAAHLAVHFSPLRGSARARIHVARRKEVHKPRGAKPGLVQLSGGRILDVRMQPERLRRLLGSRGRPGEASGEG